MNIKRSLYLLTLTLLMLCEIDLYKIVHSWVVHSWFFLILSMSFKERKETRNLFYYLRLMTSTNIKFTNTHHIYVYSVCYYTISGQIYAFILLKYFRRHIITPSKSRYLEHPSQQLLRILFIFLGLESLKIIFRSSISNW